jgi:hypothetical protein
MRVAEHDDDVPTLEGRGDFTITDVACVAIALVARRMCVPLTAALPISSASSVNKVPGPMTRKRTNTGG